MKLQNLLCLCVTVFLTVIHFDADAADTWSYENDKVKLGQIKYTALVKSTDSLNLKFPYNGFNFGNIQLGKYSSGKIEVIFAVDKGQFVCAHDGCHIQIMFGSEKPENYRVRSSSDGQSNILFIQDKIKFIDKAKKFQKFAVQATFYQNGPKIITFETDKLNWK